MYEHSSLAEALLDVIPSSVLLIDDSLKITYANRNFVLKSQRPEQEIIGQPITKAFPQIILEQTDFQKRIRDVFASQEPVKGQRMTYRAPGVPIRIYYYSILPLKDRVVMLVMEDITEQVRLSSEVRRIERHLASVVESAHDIVLSTDIEGRILTWNTAAEKLSRYPAFRVTGEYLFRYFSGNTQRVIKDLLTQVMLTRDSITQEAELCNEKGDVVLVSWIFSPMFGDLNQVIGFVVVGRDLTESKKLERLLLQSQKLAALGVMAGGIAHEIRNPLAICYSAAQFLLDEHISDEMKVECSTKIQAGIKKASDIIENLLKFARPSQSNEMAETNLVGVIKETIELVTHQAHVQKVVIESEFSNPDVMIRGVPGLLQQVFMNVILNAINAMPEGGVITLSQKAMVNSVEVSVQDTGIGISAEDLDRIFDPFISLNPKVKGTGLGLSISHTIIQQHLGSISAESIPGVGTRVVIRLPII